MAKNYARSAAVTARLAHKTLLDRLTRQGHRVSSVNEAIERGLLTDQDWCDMLDRFRADPALPVHLHKKQIGRPGVRR